MEKSVVSVVVVTYNSAESIIETLDSIKAQTYKNIELIISDDCSTDNTVEICKDWIKENEKYFIQSRIITANKNSGISANCNRGFQEASGEWIKSIAGDDCLLPNCIRDNIDFVEKNKNINILFSKVKPIGNIEVGKRWPYLNPEPFFKNLSTFQFQIMLCEKNFLPAASLFIRKDVWKDLGQYNEDISLIEDWPMWMKAVNSGYILSFLNKETVEYRFSSTSVSLGGRQSEKYRDSVKKCVNIGQHYLHHLNLFARFYYFTMSHANTPIKKVFHYINIANPFYYQYNRTLRLFNKILSQINTNLED